MSTRVISGRNIVLAIITSYFLVSLTSMTFQVSMIGLSVDKLITYTTRLTLAGLMFYFLYQGKNWAKWLAGILEAISGFLGLVSGFYFGGDNPRSALLLIMGAVFLASAYFLFFSSQVKDFLAQQNSRSSSSNY